MILLYSMLFYPNIVIYATFLFVSARLWDYSVSEAIASVNSVRKPDAVFAVNRSFR